MASPDATEPSNVAHAPPRTKEATRRWLLFLAVTGVVTGLYLVGTAGFEPATTTPPV
jgi:hypothetical protein